MENIELDWPNKILLTEIRSLHKLEKGCFASNEFFAILLGTSKSAASKRITQLKKLGYIKTRDVYEGKQCTGRIITPMGKTTESKTKPSDKFEKKIADSSVMQKQFDSSVENQTKITNKHLETSIEDNHDEFLYSIGSSYTTIGVVPEQQGGSSQKNTNNTNNKTDIKNQLINQNTGENEIAFVDKNRKSSTQIQTKTSYFDEISFPDEFYEVQKKIAKSGWNSLSVPEAAIYWKYKKEYIKVITSQPNASENTGTGGSRIGG